MSQLKSAFTLGVKVAEHVHGLISSVSDKALLDAIFDTLKQVANSDLTLLDTPEETIAAMPAPPEVLKGLAPEIAEKLQEWAAKSISDSTAKAMRDQREVANELLKLMGEK